MTRDCAKVSTQEQGLLGQVLLLKRCGDHTPELSPLRRELQALTLLLSRHLHHLLRSHSPPVCLGLKCLPLR